MSFQASVVAKRHWKSWAERRDASLNSELAEAAITEETHVLHPSENNLGMNVYTTIINLSPGKKGLQHLLYIIKQNLNSSWHQLEKANSTGSHYSGQSS